MKKFIIFMLAVLGLTFVAPTSVFAHHATVSGSTTCLDSRGASVLTWSVLYPNEEWATNSGLMTITTDRVSVSPNPLTRGNTATGSETVAWGNTQNIRITVYSVWANKQTSKDTFTIRKPESCPPVTTTTTTTVPATTTTVPVTTVPVTTIPVTTTVATTVPPTTIAATTTVPAPSSTVPTSEATTTTVSVLDTTVTTVPPITVVPQTTTVVTTGKLPATGFDAGTAILAALFIVSGIALVIVRRRK